METTEVKSEVNGKIESRAEARAAVLAELEAAPPSEGQNADPAPTEPAAPDPEAAPAVEAKPEPVDAADEDAPEPVTDPDTAKRIASVQRAEKRSRDLLAKERAEIADVKAQFDRERAEWAQQLDEIKAFAKLKARARYAPAEVLAELGLSEDDFEPAARDLYTRSKAGSADPKNKEAALRMQQQREYQDRVDSLQKKIDEMERRDAERTQASKYEAAWQSFYGDIVKKASDEASESPLLRSTLSKNPTRAQQAIQQVAAKLYDETGEWPDVDDVIVTYEKHRRAELEELGIDVATKPVADKKTTKTIAPGKSAGTPPPKARRSTKEEREEVLRALERGQLE